VGFPQSGFKLGCLSINPTLDEVIRDALDALDAREQQEPPVPAKDEAPHAVPVWKRFQRFCQVSRQLAIGMVESKMPPRGEEEDGLPALPVIRYDRTP
jgi:hypothetical protein